MITPFLFSRHLQGTFPGIQAFVQAKLSAYHTHFQQPCFIYVFPFELLLIEKACSLALLTILSILSLGYQPFHLVQLLVIPSPLELKQDSPSCFAL